MCVCAWHAVPVVCAGCIQELASTRLREYPTLPADDKLTSVDRGELWPQVFCAFRGCNWAATDGNEGQLHDHLHAQHGSDLSPIAACTLRGSAPDAFLSIYNEGIAVKCRSQAPIAGCSSDRKALKAHTDACKGNKVERLICFVCNCIHTYVEELAAEGKGDIDWVRPLDQGAEGEELLFLNRPVDETATILCLETFLDRYGKVSDTGHCLQDHESFGGWCLRWPSNLFPVGRKILCCPEDVGKKLSGA